MIRLPLGYDDVIVIDELESPEGMPQWRIRFGREGVFHTYDEDPGKYFVEPYNEEAQQLTQEVSSDLPGLLKKLSKIMRDRDAEV